ncbi:MAG: T9SS type A sorting domain-containing protein, partial [Paludibacter sp.]
YQYGQNYISDLTSWVSNSAKNKAGLVLNATTGATLPSHGTRTCKWDGMNASSVIQVDGSYTVKLEIIDQEGGATVGSTGHKLATYTFTKGATSSTGTLSGTASSSFNNVTLAWVPTSPAGVNEVQLSNLYSVYPNPTKSTVFVSGVDIKQIELCDLSGRRIFTSNEQKINLANLPKGTYLANVITEKGTFIKKIIKE